MRLKEFLAEERIVKVVETPELRKQGLTFESHYRIEASEIPEEVWEAKAFTVDGMNQVSSFKGIGDITFKTISSKRPYGTQSSGGSPNTLQVRMPDNVYVELVKLMKKGKFYSVRIATKQPQSIYSTMEHLFIKGGTLK